MAIHTRSLKYGKLEEGQLVCVPSTLVKRCKNHFIELPCKIHVILSTNGYIWISGNIPSAVGNAGQIADVVLGESESFTATQERAPADKPTREKIARVRNCILALSAESLSIHPDSIMSCYESSLELQAKDILLPENVIVVTHTARLNATARRS